MGMTRRLGSIWHRAVSLLCITLLMVGVWGCAKPTEPTVLLSEPGTAPNRLTNQLAEVSPPEALQTLKQVIDAYTPQVRILSPRPGEIMDDTTVSVRVQVRGLSIFKNDQWQMGPHLHVMLDDEPYRAVYDLSQPLVFTDLAPGTHTLRVFASRPWHESFKNQGAFDERTFHVFAPTPQKTPDPSAPLLTYSRPQGTYGAEPIMLDFYLTNAPLHMTAQQDPKDDIQDWRIRCTINGQSFVFDRWQSIYLKGFQPGRNWVQLELLNEKGEPIENRFNNTVRVIDYQPGGDDTLSRLVRGELALKEVAGIIDPTYVPPVKPNPAAATEEVPVQETPEESIESGESGIDESGTDTGSPDQAIPSEAEDIKPPAAPTKAAPTKFEAGPKSAEPAQSEASQVDQQQTPTMVPPEPKPAPDAEAEGQPPASIPAVESVPSPKPVSPPSQPAPSLDESQPDPGLEPEGDAGRQNNPIPGSEEDGVTPDAMVPAGEQPVSTQGEDGPSGPAADQSAPEAEIGTPAAGPSPGFPGKSLRQRYQNWRQRVTPTPEPDLPQPLRETAPADLPEPPGQAPTSGDEPAVRAGDDINSAQTESATDPEATDPEASPPEASDQTEDAPTLERPFI